MGQILRTRAALALLLVGIVGCNERDELVRKMAADTVEQQGAQNRAMAELNEEIAVATRRLTEEQARSREAHEAAQKHIRSQFDALESERRQIAGERHHDPIVAAAILRLGLIAASLTPLLLCWSLLRSTEGESSAEAVNAILLDGFTTEEPRLLPRSNSQAETLLTRPEDDSSTPSSDIDPE